MSRKELSEHTGTPVRTLEGWEAERRTLPGYILRLLGYQLRTEYPDLQGILDRIEIKDK